MLVVFMPWCCDQRNRRCTGVVGVEVGLVALCCCCYDAVILVAIVRLKRKV